MILTSSMPFEIVNQGLFNGEEVYLHRHHPGIKTRQKIKPHNCQKNATLKVTSTPDSEYCILHYEAVCQILKMKIVASSDDGQTLRCCHICNNRSDQ